MKTVHQQPVVTISPVKSWNSAIYEGAVTHHRQTPKQHAFTYRLYHLFLDLDEVDGVLSGTRWWRNESVAPATFRQRDYLPGSGTLADRTRDLVQQRLGFRPSGPIRLLTHLRTFGISFNPVSFYYCFSANEELVAIIAEISNIPWLERFSYVLDCRNLPADKLVFNLNKSFHISPFMGMQQNYTWHFSLPEERLAIQMNSFQDNRPIFTASLQHQRHPISASALDGLLWRYPAMPMQVIAAIYWQAGRLWWKGVPVHDHPEPSPTPLTPITHAD